MSRAVLLTGTSIAESPKRLLRAGKLEATFDAGALRWIRWNGVEVLRGLTFLVRTPGWGTPAPAMAGLEVREEATGFSVSYEAHFGVAGKGLRVAIGLRGEASGRLRAEAKIHAEAPFDTNRTGFVILHPLDGFAGTEVTIDHASQPPRDFVIPARISPGQPVMDIRAITHRPVAGLTVETRFEGDVFEMEDHRNWSDASFKTYSRPIGLPYPYRLEPGQPVTQAVTVTLLDQGAGGTAALAVSVPDIAEQLLPDYALPIDRLTDAGAALACADALRALAPGWILLRFDTRREGPDAHLSSLAKLVALAGAKLEVQVILAASTDLEGEAELATLAARFVAAGISPARVGAFAKIDEQSFQPGQPRPAHPSDAAISAALAQHFPDAERIGGSPAFFTEFNRKRPDPKLWEGLNFTTTPVVHAADDASVMETLQSLPHILSSARALADGLPLLIGPTGIGARLNPYGQGPSLNDPEDREGMAARDPRQRGLFAAAWTVGYVTRIAPFAPARFAFGAPTGPFGLISTGQGYGRPFWDDRPDGAFYPLYHVARILAAAAKGEVIEARTDSGIARLVWRKGGSRHALIANLTPAPLTLPATGFSAPKTSLLDAATIADFSTAGAHALPAALDAYAVLHLEERQEK